MKGIAILLMVLGHSLPNSTIGDYMRGFIYSFHMPLFFLISGYFYRKRSVFDQIKKDFYGLILPYMIFCFLLMFYGLFQDLYGNITFPHETIKWFKISFYGSYNPNVQLGNWIGPIWFLLGLFWCKTVFNFLYSENENKNIVLFVFLPIIISYLFKYLYITLYVLQGLTSIIFYHIGYLARKNNLLNKKYSELTVLLLFIIWIYCIFFSRIDMQSSHYDNFIINVIGAVSGTYFVYLSIKYIEIKISLIMRILIYFGKYSLIVLCFHSLDYTINPFVKIINEIQSLLPITQGHFYRYFIGLRLIYVFFVLLIIPRISISKKIFSIK
jgi:fucose 4-O-acetylase-like acetyltransferase